MRTRHTAALVAALCALGLATERAEAQQSAAPPPGLAGTYTLVQVDEAELPVMIGEADGCRQEITAATLALEAGNRWTLDAKVKETCGETVTEKTAIQTGTFTESQQALRFTAAPAEGAAAQEQQERATITIQAITEGAVNDGAVRVTLGEGESRRTLVFRR